MPTTSIMAPTVFDVADRLRAAAEMLTEAAEANQDHGTPLDWQTIGGARQDAIDALEEIA